MKFTDAEQGAAKTKYAIQRDAVDAHAPLSPASCSETRADMEQK